MIRVADANENCGASFLSNKDTIFSNNDRPIWAVIIVEKPCINGFF